MKNEKDLIIQLIEFSDQLNIHTNVKFTDLSFSIYANKIKILLSIFIKEKLVRDENNDEIVMECELIRDIKKINIDISDSLGDYYFEDSFQLEDTQLINVTKDYFLSAINKICN